MFRFLFRRGGCCWLVSEQVGRVPLLEKGRKEPSKIPFVLCQNLNLRVFSNAIRFASCCNGHSATVSAKLHKRPRGVPRRRFLLSASLNRDQSTPEESLIMTITTLTNLWQGQWSSHLWSAFTCPMLREQRSLVKQPTLGVLQESSRIPRGSQFRVSQGARVPF